MKILSRSTLSPTDLAGLTPASIFLELGAGSERMLNRHGALLCLAAARAFSAELRVSCDIHRVGLYCVTPGDFPDPEVENLLDESTDALHRRFRKTVPPLNYLKHRLGGAVGWVSVATGIRGPTRAFTHERFGVRHAAEQARLDLADGSVTHGLVVAARAGERETAGALLFVRGGGDALEETRDLARHVGMEP